MHPPWIILQFLFYLNAVRSLQPPDLSESNDDFKLESESSDREKRLIPYMTYYITKNQANVNSENPQRKFVSFPRSGNPVPFVTSPDGSESFQNIGQYHITSFPKSVIGLKYPLPTATTFKVENSKVEAPQNVEEAFKEYKGLYGSKSATVRPIIHRLHPTEPSQTLIKIVPVPIQQSFPQSQIIRLVPVVSKPVSGTEAPKIFRPAESLHNGVLLRQQHTQTSEDFYSLPHNQNNYKKSKSFKVNNVEYPLFTPVGVAPTYDLSKLGAPSTAGVPVGLEKTPYLVGGYKEVQNDGTGQYDPGFSSHILKPISVTGPSFQSISPQPEIRYQAEEISGRQNPVPKPSIQFVHTGKLPRLRVPQENEIRFIVNVTPIPVNNDLKSVSPPPLNFVNEDEANSKTSKDSTSLNSFLSILQETNKLPKTLTPTNIDEGIKTLALILERLQSAKRIQSHKSTQTDSEITGKPQHKTVTEQDDELKKVQSFPQTSGTSTPGRPGIDYPTYFNIPQTSFNCSTQRYKGFFGDPETNCQVWHYCDLNGGQASFLCPNGTIFSQVALTCDWWFNVKCATTSQLYVLNERLYKYILPFSPSFPEDYSGPVVDRYLTAKFRELETKSKSKELKGPPPPPTSSTPQPETYLVSSTESPAP